MGNVRIGYAYFLALALPWHYWKSMHACMLSKINEKSLLIVNEHCLRMTKFVTIEWALVLTVRAMDCGLRGLGLISDWVSVLASLTQYNLIMPFSTQEYEHQWVLLNCSAGFINSFTATILLVILLTLCHTNFFMLLWRILNWINQKSFNWYFLSSPHLSAWFCIDIIMRNSVLVSHQS